MATNGKDTRKSREAKAEHNWIDAQGNVVDSIEQASGTQYVSKETGGRLNLIVPDNAARVWLAAFGLRTLATNEASASRQAGGSGADQLQAISERYDLLCKGEQFVERSREGGGFRVNVEALANAIADVQVRTKKIAKDARDSKVADLIAKVTEVEGEKQLAGKPLRFWLSAPGVRDYYDQHLGKSVASLDDLGAI